MHGRMQVEVSKHTEGTKEKMLRPNGLPESLIRYDGTYWTLYARVKKNLVYDIILEFNWLYISNNYILLHVNYLY